MRTYITTLLLATTLILASCGGGNDVASSGATAVSAAATPDVSPASAPPTTSVATQTTEPKINGQIDERTGVEPVSAKMTAGRKKNPPETPTGGCMSSEKAYRSLSKDDQIDCTTRTNAYEGTCNAEGGHYTTIKTTCPLYDYTQSDCTYIKICQYGPCTGQFSKFGICD